MTDTSTPTEVTLQRKKLASNPHKHAWVLASAGSGKTTVLVRRILRLLLTDGIYPENILAITYTKSAAAEMSNRIAKRLNEWVVLSGIKLEKNIAKVLGSEPSKEDIQNAKRLFAHVLDTKGGLKIQTIHSFCQSLLQKFPMESGVAQGFKIIADKKPYIKEAKAELFLNDDILPYLQQRFMAGGRKENFDNDLVHIIDHSERFKEMFKGNIDAVVDDIYVSLNIKKEETEQIAKHAYNDFFKTKLVSELISEFKEKLISTGKTGKTIEKLVNGLTDWQKHGDVEDLEKLIFKEKSILKPTCVNVIKENIGMLNPIEDAKSECLQKIALIKVIKYTTAMYFIADKFIDIYNSVKAKHNALDFSDIIDCTRRLLSNENISPWVLYKTDRGHSHILLDEAQDTSPEQWDIMKAIVEPFFDGTDSSNHSLFVVGDEKQSIYYFQGADPQKFLRFREYYKELSEERSKGSFEDVRLDTSFRTTPAVLDWVDASFKNKQKGVSASEIKHQHFRVDFAGEIQLLPILYSQKNMRPKVKDCYAQEIANHINAIIGHKKLSSVGRTATAGDIIVLVRKRDDFVPALVRELKLLGVPVASSDRMKLTEQIVVEDLLAIIQFMILQDYDLNLACVLKCPLIGLIDEDIFKFAHGRGKRTLWQSLRQYNDSTGEFASIVEYLNKLLNMADFVRPFETLAYILNNPCPLISVKGLGSVITGRQAFEARLGVEAEDPISELMQFTISFEAEEIPTLQNFLNYINTVDDEIKRDQESSGAEQVRIMTVHSSKGLESPIVILPNCFNAFQAKNGFAWNEDNKKCLWLPTIKYNEIDNDLRFSPEKLINDIIRKENEENKRLMYVAMTRAEDILICGGYGSDGKDRDAEEYPRWYDLMHTGMKILEENDADGFKVNDYVPYRNNDIWKNKKQLEKPFSNEVFIYRSGNKSNNANQLQEEENKSVVAIPDWAITNAKSEAGNACPLLPSKILTEEYDVNPSPLIKKDGVYLFKRGNIIHRALELLPAIKPEKQELSLINYLSTPAFGLDEKVQRTWANEIMSVINNNLDLFSIDTFAEISVSGVIYIDEVPTPVSGVIDRICIKDDCIIIVDFKSNVSPPSNVDDVSEGYKKQIEIYKILIEKIYPDKLVKTVIVWTFSCKVMEIRH